MGARILNRLQDVDNPSEIKAIELPEDRLKVLLDCDDINYMQDNVFPVPDGMEELVHATAKKSDAAARLQQEATQWLRLMQASRVADEVKILAISWAQGSRNDITPLGKLLISFLTDIDPNNATANDGPRPESVGSFRCDLIENSKEEEEGIMNTEWEDFWLPSEELSWEYSFLSLAALLANISEEEKQRVGSLRLNGTIVNSPFNLDVPLEIFFRGRRTLTVEYKPS